MQRNATTLSVVGAVALLWSSLSLFSALESAFNIIYGRPNRPFLRGKVLAVVYMTSALVVLFAGLTAGTFGYDLLRRYAADVVSNRWVALALTLLRLGRRALPLPPLRLLPPARTPGSRRREVLPGAILGAIVLAGTLQALPLFVFLTSEVVALQALGTTFLLLIWLYVMANVIVFGAALNYVLAYGLDGRPGRAEAPEEPDAGCAGLLGGSASARASAAAARARCEWRRFQSSPSSATVRVSPSGTKTGSKPKPSVPAGGPGDRPSSVPRRPPRGRRRRAPR